MGIEIQLPIVRFDAVYHGMAAKKAEQYQLPLSPAAVSSGLSGHKYLIPK